MVEQNKSSPSAPGWVNNSNEHGAFQLWVLL